MLLCVCALVIGNETNLATLHWGGKILKNKSKNANIALCVCSQTIGNPNKHTLKRQVQTNLATGAVRCGLHHQTVRATCTPDPSRLDTRVVPLCMLLAQALCTGLYILGCFLVPGAIYFPSIQIECFHHAFEFEKLCSPEPESSGFESDSAPAERQIQDIWERFHCGN